MKKYKWEQEQASAALSRRGRDAQADAGAGWSGTQCGPGFMGRHLPSTSTLASPRQHHIFSAHLTPPDRHLPSYPQISHMKEYIARFGHGSAKLARQAQSKEKTLDKMVRSGLTEKVAGEKVVRLRFENVGKLPPPVLQFTQVWRGGRGEQRCRHPSQHSRSHCSSSPPVIRRPIFSRPPLPCSSHASTPPAPPRLPAGCIWVQPQQGALHKRGPRGGP